MHKHVALIAGASGAVGTALARELATRNEWKVSGIARRAPATPLDGVSYSQLDLNDSESCIEALSSFGDVTHVFYCCRAPHTEQVLESAEDNLRLLDNLLHGIELVAKNLVHVHLVQGGKYYGVHIGPFPTPAREVDLRMPNSNFNYAQQDYLIERSTQREWSWSSSRPNTLLHFSPHIARNLVSSLGAYAAICRELGAAFDFPGPPGAFDSVTQMTTIELLARGITWITTEPGCRDQAFNMTNTDVFRWNHLWPFISEVFDMPMGSVRPLKLAYMMSERKKVWQYICDKNQLKKTTLDQVANWSFADATLERYWDEILSHNKARRYGFHDWDDSESRFLSILKQYQDARILPV